MVIEVNASFRHLVLVEAIIMAWREDSVCRHNCCSKVIEVHLPITFPIETIGIVAHSIEAKSIGGKHRGGRTTVVITGAIVSNIERAARMARGTSYHPTVVLVAIDEGPSVGVVVIKPTGAGQRVGSNGKSSRNYTLCHYRIQAAGVNVDVIDGAGGESRQGE